MNEFGNFLYALRKEKGMTQAELAGALGVTNKAVSKWETGEAMPETGLLLPISRIFGVTADELLAGKRSEDANGDYGVSSKEEVKERGGKNEPVSLKVSEIRRHIFINAKDGAEPRALIEKISAAICAVIMLSGVAVYLCLGTFAELWTPYWVILPVSALSCGLTGTIFDLCNSVKRDKKIERGENPYTGAAAGIIILSAIIAYLLLGALCDLWHPYWIIVAAAGLACGIVGAIGGIFTGKKTDRKDDRR